MKLSALDVVPVFEGETAKDAFDRSAKLAKHLEEKDFERYLVAEHHNLGGTASSSTSNVIQYILGNTDKIRVGAGGVMLSNHSPLQVAETYGTLEELYPNRVDLGIGRAPGTDQLTASLITRKNYMNLQEFLNDINLIDHFLGPVDEDAMVGAYPGADSNVPLIVLGSSTSSALVAAELGLMYAFAGHINPADAKTAIELYRKNFKPSKHLDKPYVMLGSWLFAADTDEEADKLFEHTQRKFLKMLKKGEDDGIDRPLTSAEKILLTKVMGMNIKGSKETIKPQIEEIIETYQPDELITVTQMSELDQLKKNYDLLQEVVEEIEK